MKHTFANSRCPSFSVSRADDHGLKAPRYLSVIKIFRAVEAKLPFCFGIDPKDDVRCGKQLAAIDGSLEIWIHRTARFADYVPEW